MCELKGSPGFTKWKISCHVNTIYRFNIAVSWIYLFVCFFVVDVLASAMKMAVVNVGDV